MALDPRLVQVGIEVNGRIKIYQNLQIRAEGVKYANPNQNECEIQISNLDKATQDYILTETSPFNLNRTPKRVFIDAGRVSYGTVRIYSGNIISASITQPPDITIGLKCLTGNFQKGNIISRTQIPSVSLSQLSREVAADLGLALRFEASDKTITNYTFTGAALKQVNSLNDTGLVDAYIDDDSLIVKNLNIPLRGIVKVLNSSTGMIGIPEFTEQGIRVRFLLDNQTVLGGGLQIESKIYPATKGTYVIYKLSFDITNRDIPFYWIAEAKRL